MSALRWIGFSEAVSYIALLAIAVPLKYLAGIPEPVRYLGMAHGVLFMAYVVAITVRARSERWSATKIAAGITGAFIPLGPFVLDRALTDTDPWRERAP